MASPLSNSEAEERGSSTSSDESIIPLISKIESVPNLRLLCTRSSGKGTNPATRHAAIYRSSKPDRISVEDVAHFSRLGIKTIVDFRSLDEYRKTDGMCFLDKEYSLYKVTLPKKGYTPEDDVDAELITPCDSSKLEFNSETAECKTEQHEKRHFLVNFFSSSYIMAVIKRVPWYLMIVAFFYAIYDLLRRNKFKTLTSFFLKHSINKAGIIGQYKDIVDVSGNAICAALKLVSDQDNLPVMINCAHGKDRTGILSALILLCLGMSEEYVQIEYSLSKKGLKPIQHIMEEDLLTKWKLDPEFGSAEVDTMTQLLAHLNSKYGTVQQYMTHIGFPEKDQQRLCDNLMAFEHPEAVEELKKASDDGFVEKPSDNASC